MLYFSWQRWLGRQSGSSRRECRKRARPSFYRPQLELFEERVVLSTIQWINPASGNWEDPSNWSSGTVPGPGDDVIINVPGDITVTHDTGNDTVQSLTSQQNLLITGGSSLTVSGAFTESSNEMLTVDQAASFTADAPSTIDGANLYAFNGSTLSLRGATGYNASNANFSPTIQADGSGSVLDLSSVASWQGAGNANVGYLINVEATNGGTVNLSQLTQITAGNTRFYAQTDGQINLSALTTFSGAAVGGYNLLNAESGGAAITAPNLTSLSNVDLQLAGNATLPVSSLSSFVDGDIYVYNDGSVGGMLALPVTTINEANATFSPIYQADGSGSVLDLSSVTSWQGAGNASVGYLIDVEATNGGTVNLSQLAQITAGNTRFYALTGGQINLSALTTFSGAAVGGYNLLDAASGGAAITAPNLTSLSNVDLQLSGNATLPVSSLSSFVDGDIYVYNDGSVGGMLALPVTTINEANATFSPIYQADGSGSVLDLSSVTSWQGAGNASVGYLIDVEATNGGTVNLSQLAQITAGNTRFYALTGGQINLSALTTFSGAAVGGYNLLDAASGGAAITAPNLTSLSNVDLQLSGNATLPVSSLSSFVDGDIYVYNDGSVGGMLALPVTTINEANATFSPIYQADGSGSVLDLSSVTSWQGAGNANVGYLINVEATNGGTVNLSQLTQITAGNTRFYAQTGGQINLSALTTFSGAAVGGYNLLDAETNGMLTLTSGTVTVSNVNVFVDPTGIITAGTLDLSTGSLLTGSGTITANLINDAEIQFQLATDTLEITGDYTQNVGTVTMLGTLTVDGQLTWAGGTITGSGTVNADGGLSLSSDGDLTLDGWTLNDNGPGTWTGLGNLIIGDGAILNLLGSASLDIQNDQAILNTLGGDATVNDGGLLDKSAGTGTTSIQVAFSNFNTLEVQSGTLSVSGAFSNFAGSTLAGGSYFIAGTFQFPGADIVTNAATIVLDGPAAQIIDQAGNDALANFTTNAGNFTIQDGLNFTAGDFTDTGSLTVGAGSTFTINGTYTEAGTLNVLTGGTLNAAGSFTNFSGGTLTGGTYRIGGTFQFVDAALVTNDATLVLIGSTSQIVDQANNDALANFASNDVAGSLTIQDGRDFTTAGDFSNAGSLTVGDGSTLTVTGAYTQAGTLSIFSGTVDLLGGGSANGNLINLGTLIIDVGSTFTVTGSLTLTGTVNVQAGATLNLADGSSNGGVLNVAGSVVVNGSFGNSGDVSLLNGSTLTVSGDYTQTDGSTTLSGGTLSASGLVDLQGGELSGSGTIAASVQNAALIVVGESGAPGLLSITGDYTQTSSGVLTVEIGGYNAGTDFDQLAIGGTANLDGTLNVSLINGFTPLSGDSFQVLTFATLNGTFASTNLDPAFSNPPTYDATDVTVQAM